MKESDIQYLASLVRLSQQGSSDAFAELYAMTFSKVYNYARHYLRDDYLAQDAVQEIYILALKNLTKLKDPTLFIAWVNHIAFHVCFDMSKQRKGSDQYLDAELLEVVEDVSISANPEASFQEKDQQQRIQDALEQIPFAERQVVVMRFFNNMKLEEIAAACDISRSTVKRYLAKGQERLRKILKG